MKKEKIQQKGAEDLTEGGLAGPIAPSAINLDTINIDNPKGIPEEFTGENFDALVRIYQLLNSPESDRLKIDYGQTEDGKKTATVFIDGQLSYFTQSEKEIENFHLWSKHKQERKEARDKKAN